MQALIESYDRLKSKFNQFQTRCLTEKQKKECGLAQVAPNLIMPREKDLQDQEYDLNDQNGEGEGAGQSRMGGRIGVRMGGIGEDQDGDVPPDDIEANQPRGNGGGQPGKEESKNNSGGQRVDPFAEN